MSDRTKAALLFLAFPVIVVYHAWAITILWRWSLVTVGVPQIEIAPAIALASLVSLIHPRRITKDESALDEGALVGQWIFGPLLLLGVAWLARLVTS